MSRAPGNVYRAVSDSKKMSQVWFKIPSKKSNTAVFVLGACSKVAKMCFWLIAIDSENKIIFNLLDNKSFTMQPRITAWPGSWRSEDDVTISEINYCDTLTMSLTRTIRRSDNLLCLPCVEISRYRNVRIVGGRTILWFVDQMFRTYSLRKVSRQGSRVCQFLGPRLGRNRQGKAHLCQSPVEPESRHLGTSDLRRKISSRASKSSESDGKSRSLRTGHWPAGRPGRAWGRSLGGLLGSSSRDCLGKTETVRCERVTRWQVRGPASAHCGHLPPQCPGLWQHYRVSWHRWSISHWTWNTEEDIFQR